VNKLEGYKHTMESCNHCGQCKWLLGPKTKGWQYAEICPIHMKFHFDAYSGQGLLNIAREMLEGELQYDEGLINLVYSCTTCGACDVNCKSIRDMEVLETILALRAQCVEDDQAPLPVHQQMAKNIQAQHNIYGRDHSERFSWLSEDIQFNEDSTVAYFVGCSASYVHTDIARDTARILNAGGVDFTVLHANEYCCGNPLWQTGQRDATARLVDHHLNTFRQKGIKTVVTSCAECFGALRTIYPRFAELDFEVRHISEVVFEMLQQGKLHLNKNLDMKVTYHDPCHLGRLSEPYVPWKGEIKAFGYHDPPKQWRRGTNGVYDAPREVLKAIPGIDLVEMTRNEENALCCGAGGGVRAAFPAQALNTAKERLDEAESTGAEAIISACPFCRSNFEDVIDTDKNYTKYYDLTALIARAL